MCISDWFSQLLNLFFHVMTINIDRLHILKSGENVFSSCCSRHAANDYQIYVIWITTRINTLSCDVLEILIQRQRIPHEVLSFLAYLYHYVLTKFFCSPDNWIKRLILPNKASFTRHKSFSVSNIHSLMKFP